MTRDQLAELQQIEARSEALIRAELCAGCEDVIEVLMRDNTLRVYTESLDLVQRIWEFAWSVRDFADCKVEFFEADEDAPAAILMKFQTA